MNDAATFKPGTIVTLKNSSSGRRYAVVAAPGLFGKYLIRALGGAHWRPELNVTVDEIAEA